MSEKYKYMCALPYMLEAKSIKITTTVKKEDMELIRKLKREGVQVNDLIKVALELWFNDSTMFYALLYKVKKSEGKI